MAEIERIGVLGAGWMGSGIAQVFARAGLSVVLADRDRALADRGRAEIEERLTRSVDKGKLEPTEKTELLGRIRVGDDAGALSDVQYVLEAASEDIELKKRLFRQLDEVCSEGVILGTNTSSIPITTLAAQTRRRSHVIGVHFMNPPPLMKLVEVIPGLDTSDETYAATLALLERCDKETVTSRDAPGFIVNRILIPMINEACFAHQEGLGSMKDIDKAARLGIAHPLGPFELADLMGLDTCLAIADVLHRELGEDKYRPATLLRNHVAAGRLGRKVGRGFYAYDSK